MGIEKGKSMIRVEKYIYLVVGLVLVGVAVGIGVYAMASSNKQEGTKEENDNNTIKENVLEDGITLKDTKIDGDSIIQEYLIVLNGKENYIQVEFRYNLSVEYYLIGNINLETVTGIFNDYEFYFYETFSDEDIFKDSIFNIEVLTNKFNENNFKIISGQDDKNYLLIITYNHYSMIPSNSEAASLYIFNDDLEIVTSELNDYSGCSNNKMTISSGITTYILEDDLYPWYDDEFNICLGNSYCRINVKIANNHIYYLMPTIDYSLENGYGILEERVYTIYDNELEYEVINTYTIIGGVGYVC